MADLVCAVVRILSCVVVDSLGDLLREAHHVLGSGGRLPCRRCVLGTPGADGAPSVRTALILERGREAAVAGISSLDCRVLQLVAVVVSHVHSLPHHPPSSARHRCHQSSHAALVGNW